VLFRSELSPPAAKDPNCGTRLAGPSTSSSV
jgi:hypothetical protein